MFHSENGQSFPVDLTYIILLFQPSPSVNRSASPDYFRGVHPWSPAEFAHPSRECEYVGIPLEPPPLPHNYDPDEEESGPSTAEIIANQSQDYIDEKLAEYQMTIYQLQGEYGPALFYGFREENCISFRIKVYSHLQTRVAETYHANAMIIKYL